MAEVNLSAQRLREFLHYEPLTGLFTWLKTTTNRVKVGATAGTITSHGYVEIRLLGVKHYAHRLAWFYMTGKWPTEIIDHKDRVKTNNRFANLREASQKQNLENSDKRGGVSGVRGVYWHKQNRNWVVAVKVNKASKHIGCFATKAEAIEARTAAVRRFYTHAPECE